MITKAAGSVVAAHCTCTARLGEACSHIAALMFELEAANCLGYTSKACTEKAWAWNKDCLKGTAMEPCPIQELQFVKPNYSAKPIQNPKSGTAQTRWNISSEKP